MDQARGRSQQQWRMLRLCPPLLIWTAPWVSSYTCKIAGMGSRWHIGGQKAYRERGGVSLLGCLVPNTHTQIYAVGGRIRLDPPWYYWYHSNLRPGHTSVATTCPPSPVLFTPSLPPACIDLPGPGLLGELLTRGQKLLSTCSCGLATLYVVSPFATARKQAGPQVQNMNSDGAGAQ